MRYFWYHECPFCHQGRLLIAKDVTHDSLYLHCEECERGWRDPEHADDPKASFLTLNEDFEGSFPDESEIDRMGWTKYKLHSFDD
jgi:hypothetical protein